MSSDRNKREKKLRDSWYKNTPTHNFTEVSSDVAFEHKRIGQGWGFFLFIYFFLNTLYYTGHEAWNKMQSDYILKLGQSLVYTSACPLEGRKEKKKKKKAVLQKRSVNTTSRFRSSGSSRFSEKVPQLHSSEPSHEVTVSKDTSLTVDFGSVYRDRL